MEEVVVTLPDDHAEIARRALSNDTVKAVVPEGWAPAKEGESAIVTKPKERDNG